MSYDVTTSRPLIVLWNSIEKKRRKKFKILILVMILTSFTEVISIGAIVPFLAVLTNPEAIYDYTIVEYFIGVFGIVSDVQILFTLTVLFILATLFAGLMRILLLWVYTRFSYDTGVDLGLKLYKNVLNEKYESHINRNSSEVLNALSTKINDVVFKVITPLLLLISNMVIIIVIMLFLFLLDPFVAIFSLTGFGLIYVFIGRLNKDKLIFNSKEIANESNNVVKNVQEGLGSIRDIIINNVRGPYLESFRLSSVKLRGAQSNNDIMIQAPKFLMESLGIILIACAAYFMTTRTDDITTIVPILGAMALGGQRLLPLSQRVYMSWSSIKGSSGTLHDILDLIKPKEENKCNSVINQSIGFDKVISLKGVYFKHRSSPNDILSDINLDIERGDCVGFIGKTGSGKSTLIDIIMGLLQPTRGFMMVDRHKISMENINAWQSNIAHVPQDIFLIDDSIEKNIAFGIKESKINLDLVKRVADQAELSSLIESWPDKYKTCVGERGVQISGGQKQRIGIARALYKEADVLVLDEATSALDVATEERIMSNINKLNGNKTIIIIAHRVATLKNCKQIVKINDSTIESVCQYKDIC